MTIIFSGIANYTISTTQLLHLWKEGKLFVINTVDCVRNGRNHWVQVNGGFESMM